MTEFPEFPDLRLRAEILARDVLGCGCPDEVFDDIQFEPLLESGGRPDFGPEPLAELVIGGRLLIRIYDSRNGVDAIPPADESDPDSGWESPWLKLVVDAGIAMRDGLKMNRFRLVVIADPDSPSYGGMLTRLVATFPSMANDEKCHLHIISPEDYPLLE